MCQFRVLKHSSKLGFPVRDVDLCVRLQVLLCLALSNNPLEFLPINLFLLNQDVGSLVQDLNVALYQVLGPPTAPTGGGKHSP